MLLSEHIYYSPIEKSAVLYYHIDNASEPVNPVYMAIQFSSKSKPNLKFPYKSTIAVYKDDHLIKVMGSREGAVYPTLLADLIKNQSHQIIAQKNTGNYVLVSLAYKGFIARFLPLLTLFISLTGIMVLVLVLLNSFFHFIDDRYHLSFNMRKSLRSRFQTTITGLVLFSFVLIGGTTALYYQRLYNIKNTQSFEMLLDVLIKDIQTNFPETENAREDGRLEKAFRALESVHDLPIAFYSASGIRILSSLSYENAPERLPLTQILKENNLTSANLRVLSTIYQKNKVLIPIYDANQSVSGFFLTEDLQRSRGYAGLYDFLSTLLTLCVFLFLTALALSMIVTNPMTKSLKNLSSRLKDFKLGRDNEKLEWKNPDEVGALISNFNKMQVELNHSADLLSKTQRDLAWREMAKQVAHEIKNPLTPMKLSIQHMQNAASTEAEKTRILIQRTSATILEQIENLTQIADEFSSFGTLPKASNDTIVLNEVVEHIHDLFRKREDMDIQMAEPMNDIHVFADKNQLVRILNNIVKNATQSIPEGTRGKIDIELSQNDLYAVIKVSDNGVGIPEAMKEKVFTPNFTTKSSGTGLGLAISANMIESMNGRLYFVSPNSKDGTDFYIELPLVRNSMLGSEENQVDLD
jgi:signal transduction histidine kinase